MERETCSHWLIWRKSLHVLMHSHFINLFKLYQLFIYFLFFFYRDPQIIASGKMLFCIGWNGNVHLKNTKLWSRRSHTFSTWEQLLIWPGQSALPTLNVGYNRTQLNGTYFIYTWYVGAVIECMWLSNTVNITHYIITFILKNIDHDCSWSTSVLGSTYWTPVVYSVLPVKMTTV